MINRYYEDELNKLKHLAQEFAQANPALAPMLADSSADPDVERLLEGVAFLTGLTRQKLDDEFPEFAQELANLLFPHYLRPIPACTLLCFTPKAPLREVARIAAGVELASLPVDGTPCRFSTCDALEIQPLSLHRVELENRAGSIPRLVLEFELQGGSLESWSAESLRFFLGSGYTEAAKLLLLLANHVTSVKIGDGTSACELGPKALRLSGFDNPMLPYPSHAFPGFRALQEFFVMPEKFLFVDLTGLSHWKTRNRTNRFSIALTLNQIPEWMPEIRSDSLLLNVVPAINLFPYDAAPISHDHRITEYRVLPEGQNLQHYQVYSIDKVTGYQQGTARQRSYQPFGISQSNCQEAELSYRTAVRAATVGRGSEVFLSVNYPPEETPLPETLSVQLTCTNRNLPEGLKLGDISQPTSNSPDRFFFQNIRSVTPPLNPPSGEALLWRMIGLVSLNLLSLADAASLKSVLGLHVFGERGEHVQTAANRRRINGIQNVTATPESRLIGRGSILRGQLIRIECRPDHFAGIGDLYLFGCMLDRFLGTYAGINTYTRVEMIDALSGAAFKWPPRLGQQTLL